DGAEHRVPGRYPGHRTSGREPRSRGGFRRVNHPRRRRPAGRSDCTDVPTDAARYAERILGTRRSDDPGAPGLSQKSDPRGHEASGVSGLRCDPFAEDGGKRLPGLDPGPRAPRAQARQDLWFDREPIDADRAEHRGEEAHGPEAQEKSADSYEYPEVCNSVTKPTRIATAPTGPRVRSNHSAGRMTSPRVALTSRRSSASSSHAPGSREVNRPARRRIGKATKPTTS